MVAALGDSITAGVGARANSVLDIFTEYRCPLNFHPFFFKIHTTNACFGFIIYYIFLQGGVIQHWRPGKCLPMCAEGEKIQQSCRVMRYFEPQSLGES